jgi:cytochrome bd-type quinol oxidase subunit 1
VSLVAFILVYGLLGTVGYYLIAKYARLGPDAVTGPIADVGKGLRPAAV